MAEKDTNNIVKPNFFEQITIDLSGFVKKGGINVPKLKLSEEVEAPTVRYVEREFQEMVFGATTSVSTGDGAYYWHVSKLYDGYDLTEVHAEVITAGISGTTSVQIHNVTDSVDMLSEKLHIDDGETGSDESATPAVINADNRFIQTNDLLRVDVDEIQSEDPAGLLVTLGFRRRLR